MEWYGREGNGMGEIEGEEREKEGGDLSHNYLKLSPLTDSPKLT